MTMKTREPDMAEAEPTWGIVELFPRQGTWSEEEYFALPGNRLVEFSDGIVEVLSMPSHLHQMILFWLYRSLHAFVSQKRLGVVLGAPLRLRLWAGKYREPDLMFLFNRHLSRIHPNYWDGADLVMEVMSPDDPERDAETKRREYAQAGIPEYWLVNPMAGTITVFTLPPGQGEYTVHGVYDRTQYAESVLLPGFTVDVNACFAEAEELGFDE